MMLDPGSDISCRGEGTVWHDDMHNAKHMDCVFRTEVAEFSGSWCFQSELIVIVVHSDTFTVIRFLKHYLWFETPCGAVVHSLRRSDGNSGLYLIIVSRNHSSTVTSVLIYSWVLIWYYRTVHRYLGKGPLDIFIFFFQFCFGSKKCSNEFQVH